MIQMMNFPHQEEVADLEGIAVNHQSLMNFPHQGEVADLEGIAVNHLCQK